MRLHLILPLLLLLMASCGGGSKPAAQRADTNMDGAGQRLTLEAEPDGADWRVNLTAPAATDLYQAAGTLIYDPARYEVLAIEAGGGLGAPDSSYFLGRETQPGRIDFAYTKRFHGPGENGDVWLLSLRVRARDGFVPTDFRLDTAEGRLRLRDNKRRELRAAVEEARR